MTSFSVEVATGTSPSEVRGWLDRDSLDLIESDFIARAIVELRRSGRLVSSDLLGVLQGTAILQVSSYPSVLGDSLTVPSSLDQTIIGP